MIHVAALAPDLRIAVRRVRRAPGLTIAIVLTLGLGLGVAAAIFSASEAALVEPLPYTASERLVHLWEHREATDERSPTSFPTLVDWRTHAKSFTALEGYDPGNFTAGVGDQARMVRGAHVTGGFFRLLGVRPPLGRDFLDADASGAAVTIVSDRFARSLGHTPLNQVVTINGVAHTVVGILPPSFHFALLQDADLFVPLTTDQQRLTDRTQRTLYVVGRLHDHVTIRVARTELVSVMSQLANEYPDALMGRTIAVTSLRDALLGSMKSILTLLLVAVALLLVIMGANLALLMLTRYIERTPELVMRFALGATRARVLQQLFIESLVPSVVGTALALLFCPLLARGLLDAIPESVKIGMPYLAYGGLDAGVIIVIAGLGMLLAIGFGIGPALFMTKARERAGDARTTLGRADRQVRRALVVAQLAVTVVLLVSSGLLVISLRNLVRRDLGFGNPRGLVTARAPLSGSRYQNSLTQQQFYETLLDRTAALPGIRNASLINEVPGGGGGMTTFEPIDRPLTPSQRPRAVVRIVGGAYFSTLGVPIITGRAFGPADRTNTRPVAVISESFANLLAKDGGTIGRRLKLGTTGLTEWEVVGVVGDVQVAALDADSPPVIYLTHLQMAENRMMLVARTDLDVGAVARSLRAIVASLDPGVPVYAVSRLDHQLHESKALFTRRFPATLVGLFAAAALALAIIALYAICAHDVMTRRRELGIRLALGAAPGALRRLIFGDTAWLGAFGIVVGEGMALIVARSMQAVLFGITTTDWRVYGAVGVIVAVSVLLATVWPALRASAVDPTTVMRTE